MSFIKMSPSLKLTKIALTASLAAGALVGCVPSQPQFPLKSDVPTAVPSPVPSPVPPGSAPATTAGTATPAQSTLLSRIVVNPPAFKHPAVSEATIQAAKNAILALPAPLREKLDKSDARVIISPNMTDRWPDSMKDQPAAEKDPNPTLAEQPGRIYGLDMCVYERPKKRGSTELGPARAPAYIQLQVGDMCFQVLDDMMTLSKSESLRKEWNDDKEHIPPEAQLSVAEFTKLDDWGPRETCAEMFGSMMGGRDENTDNLYKYFPRVKKWLITRLGIEGQK